LKLTLFLILLIAATASANTGINLYGLSWHPSNGAYEWFNPGLGVRHMFVYTPRWKADVLAGFYRDSVKELLVHAALGGQYRVAGPFNLGVHFMAGAQGYALDEIYILPLPSACLEAGPADLNFHYIPRHKGATGNTSVLGFHVTVWPFGGRGSKEPRPADPDARMALEFGLASGLELTELDGSTLSLRWTLNRRHAWRAGVFIKGSHYSNSRIEEDPDGQSEYGYSSDQAEIDLLIQHLWLAESTRGTRFLAGFGPQFSYSTFNGSEEWRPGLVLTLGAEVDIVRGLSVLGEYQTSGIWTIDEALYQERDKSFNIEGMVRLGVAVWW